MTFADHFSSVAVAYAAYRPTYEPGFIAEKDAVSTTIYQKHEIDTVFICDELVSCSYLLGRGSLKSINRDRGVSFH